MSPAPNRRARAVAYLDIEAALQDHDVLTLRRVVPAVIVIAVGVAEDEMGDRMAGGQMTYQTLVVQLDVEVLEMGLLVGARKNTGHAHAALGGGHGLPGLDEVDGTESARINRPAPP